ncbi:Rrp15p-domain-containing protein [Delitschia confertaspora ATCC 74209]|uniref:Rrp15p-domain-containing protein n=1 Tax=Delitschia confertaspora ATCC 74209 TaxID=1513339 RepID=A0A9P4JRD3_9PLEO|nr:Rrp15p-domain-containing protein [Delitschia confertaspora ATCC 74209]
MPSTTLKRRWTEDGMKGKVPKKQKKFKKQKDYYSSSEDEGGALDVPADFKPVSLEDSDEELITGPNAVAMGERKPRAKSPPSKTQPKSALKNTQQQEKGDEVEAEDVDEGEDENGEDGEDGDEDEESEDDHNVAENLPTSDDEEVDDYGLESGADDSEVEQSDASTGTSVSETSTNNPARKMKKRNDPEAFATSISKILSSKLTTKNRSEPILARSKAAQETNHALSDHKLTLQAHRKLLAEKKAALDKGRIRDVLGLDRPEVSTAEIVAEEKRLRRTAQKGVIKLFNAVRAAQVKAELAQKEVKKEGVVGMKKREERVQEMSKQGFLDMIAGGGKKKETIVEA